MHQHSLHSTVFACSITKQLPQVSRLSQATLHAIPNLSPILCLYSPYVCPLCQRTSETPLLGFGVAQATLHLDMKMYDESALGMLALMFPNPPRKRHNIHTKMEAFDIASTLYLSLHHILYHFIIFHSCSFHVFHFVCKNCICVSEKAAGDKSQAAFDQIDLGTPAESQAIRRIGCFHLLCTEPVLLSFARKIARKLTSIVTYDNEIV